jgi:DNA-directed RNA polymerase II subunit RPB2
MNPLTRHHIESYDQFVQRDLRAIIASHNPITILKNPKSMRDAEGYKYTVEIYIGGKSGSDISIGIPTVSLDQGRDVRALFPNEARLRNLTYSAQIEASIYVQVKIIQPNPEASETSSAPKTVAVVYPIDIAKFPLCSMPLMLHSRYCTLHGKSAPLLQEMGECPKDQGGYFIIDGSEKVLVTRQEGAFNTLWITEQASDPNVQYYASISSLNPKTRQIKRVSFYWLREQIRSAGGFDKSKPSIYKPSVLEVSIPFILKPIPIFVLFRALGIQSDKAILQLIFPDFENPETRFLADLLIPSINAAAPFLDSYSAIQYIKSLSKGTGEKYGFGEARVLDVLHNHMFPHVDDLPYARATFLADCVRKILRVVQKLDEPPSRDDTRNQRLLTSGFLCQMLFQNIYETYVKAIKLKIDETYSYNESIYSDKNFISMFGEANRRNIFAAGHITQGLLRGFKGKWLTGSNKEESGVLQELDRLSYLNFISHLRHVILNFDTGMKLQGPRRLNPSQYGYFCTSETPSGSSIGITKNLSIMTAISTGSYTDSLLKWLFDRGSVVPCEYITPSLATIMVPVYLNSGIIGYVGNPKQLVRILRLFKRSGYMPPFSSSGFNIPERRMFIYIDDGRPLRPLLICEPRGHLPSVEQFRNKSWRELVVGSLRPPQTSISSQEFVDPLADRPSGVSLDSYKEFFEKKENANKLAIIEYLDPYEQNEALIANWPEHVLEETTHMEVHPSTILGLLGNMIPYPNHNQSPRNQLSASQSKQGLSMYATNWKNRFDNTANVLCYGQAPLSRTIYQDYIGDGQMSYGQNIILAMGMYGGYNQEDGIIMNADALARGQFRSINYRSYETFEEDDKRLNIQKRIGNPKYIPGWLDIRVNNDYSLLDDNGIIRTGSYVTQTTVLVGLYMSAGGKLKDASLTPQVWTRGRVESVVVTVNNAGLRLVKIRVVQDRVPELGDKFSNRHGQKGTINVLYRGHDMPRTADGITPDMIMNPTAIPSRMTIGQILEMILGNVSTQLGAIGNCTAFMNDGSPHELLGSILEKLGLNKMSNQVLYNGMTGEQITADIFMGVVYGMRLKHMTEDKWNARGQGRKEQRTHQPTGGRGNEGGLKIGEMERDAIIGHGITSFVRESYMERSDGTSFIVCNGCGTVPIYNERQGLYICTLCDGPIQYSGETVNTLDPIPPPVRSAVTFSKVQMPYATNLFFQELNTFMNLGARILTTHDATKLKGLESVKYSTDIATEGILQPLPVREYPDILPPPEPERQFNPTTSEVEEANEKLTQEDEVVVVPPTNEFGAPIESAATAGENQIQLQSNSIVPTTTSSIQLQPNSILPAPLAAATTNELGVINLENETTAFAMKNAGFKQPTAATEPLEQLPLQQTQEINQVNQVINQQPAPRLRRRQQQQQQTQSFLPPPPQHQNQQFYAPPMQEMNQQQNQQQPQQNQQPVDTQEGVSKQQYAQRVVVEKEG